jgi:hypothetical protein
LVRCRAAAAPGISLPAIVPMVTGRDIILTPEQAQAQNARLGKGYILAPVIEKPEPLIVEGMPACLHVCVWFEGSAMSRRLTREFVSRALACSGTCCVGAHRGFLGETGKRERKKVEKIELAEAPKSSRTPRARETVHPSDMAVPSPVAPSPASAASHKKRPAPKSAPPASRPESITPLTPASYSEADRRAQELKDKLAQLKQQLAMVKRENSEEPESTPAAPTPSAAPPAKKKKEETPVAELRDHATAVRCVWVTAPCCVVWRVCECVSVDASVGCSV